MCRVHAINFFLCIIEEFTRGRRMSKKRSLIWDYFTVNPNDSRKAVCGTCGECISRGGTTTKNFNTSNLRYNLQRVHIDKYEELEVKQQEEADKKN